MKGEKFRWFLIFRRAEQELRMRRWEILEYTLTQLVCMLDRSDPDDPFVGTIPINSLDDIDRMLIG